MTFQTYNLGVPNPPNRPSSDVPLMQVNTNAIPPLVNIDHFSFNNTLGGYHKQVHLVNEAAPGIGTASGVLFANLASGQSWPFWQNALGTAQLISQIPTLTTSGSSTGYVTSLPGGLKMTVGFNNATTDGTTINFLSTFTTIYSFTMSALGNSSTGTNRALVAQPRSINAGAGTAVVNLQDVNNNSQNSNRTVYFCVVGV
jgi:hypothetical protein